jgi:hypothetical protein
MIRERNVQNFMDKVLKMIQLHEYDFSLHYFMQSNLTHTTKIL